MTALAVELQAQVDQGLVPGAIGLIARGDQVQVAAAGLAEIETGRPMTRDTLVRIASITKPITVAALLRLIEAGRLGPHDPVATWLPELADPVVVRTPESPVDDVVPATRPITVHDLLTMRSGWGYPSRFDLPAVASGFEVLQGGGREPQRPPAAEQWLARLAEVPLLFQPGERWLYQTSADLQGVLIARVRDQPLPDALAELIFEPLGMIDTGFAVPDHALARMATYYRPGDHGWELIDAPDGDWRHTPALPSGAGGLVGTVDDWCAFARFLLAGGRVGNRQLLGESYVRAMLSDQQTPAQRSEGELFLEGQSWGWGGSVDLDTREPWNVPGRYGWVGGLGTSAHVVPSQHRIAILLTQVEMAGPASGESLHRFWTCAAA